MIARDPGRAASESYDLIVVGGGVYGIALAVEAASRGLKPLLLEKGDFGGATSWNSLRILHGGLRYLQTMDLRRFRDSTTERSRWIRDFPELIEPLPCLMPLDDSGLRRSSILRLALSANNWLSRARNADLRADQALPDGRILSVAETSQLLTGTERLGDNGCALWFDGFMHRPERVLMEMLRKAVAKGSTALNYCAVTGLVQQGGRVTGVEATDQISGSPLMFAAPIVVNCAGPWSRELATRLDRDLPELYDPSLALNMVLDSPSLSTAAVAVRSPSRGSRTYFLLPWQGRILAGTFHQPWVNRIRDERVPDETIALFVDEIDRALPGLDLEPARVMRIFKGSLPVTAPGSLTLSTRSVVRHHAESGGPVGLFSVSGVKFTTARLVARRTLSLLTSSLKTPLRDPERVAFSTTLDCPTATDFNDLLQRDSGEAALIVQQIVREESVLNLSDLLLRRTDWGTWLDAPHDFEDQVAQLTGLSDSRQTNEG